MSEQLLTRFVQSLESLSPAFKQQHFLLTVSGGMDSMVMADLFYRAQLNFSVAHCNFQLRGKDADTDEQLVKQMAGHYRTTFYCKKFETSLYAATHKLSVQMAAREIRYKWFEELRIQHKFDLIVTAHHKNDQVETVLFNIIRGKGLEAMSGIPERNNFIIRPLLNFSKAELNEYAQKQNLSWQEDASNNSVDYERNFIRLKIIPVLKEVNPSVEKTLLHFSSLAKEASVVVQEEFNKWKRTHVIETERQLTIKSLKDIVNHPLKNNLIYKLLLPFNFSAGAIQSFITGNWQKGNYYYSATHRLIIGNDELIIASITESDAGREFIIEKGNQFFGTGNFSLTMENVSVQQLQSFKRVDPNIAFVDLEKLNFPLTIRNWQRGDYFYPLGMTQRKKLSDFFIDEKISLIDKEKSWLLISGNDIVWIMGQRIDNRFKITTETKTILKITFAEH